MMRFMFLGDSVNNRICFDPYSGGSGLPAWSHTFGMVLLLVAGLLFSGCATPRPVERPDVELGRKESVARGAFDRGDIPRARDLYLEALMRAREIGDPEEIGSHAYNVALCHVLLGQHERALEYLRQARYEMDRAGMNMASLLLVEAEALLALNRADDARRAARQALQEADQPEFRAHAHRLLAVLELNAGNTDAARGEYRRARRHAQQSSLPVQARVEEVLGRIALAEDNQVEAAITYDRVAELFRRSGYFGDMAKAWILAGEAYEAEDQHAAAGYRYFQAAGSLFGQNHPNEALRMIERAIEAAERAEDMRLADEISLLYREVSNAVKKSGAGTSN